MAEFAQARGRAWWLDDDVLRRRRPNAPLRAGHPARWLAVLAGERRWRDACARLNRIWLGRDYKHLRHVADRLRLTQNDDLSYEVYWRGRHVATLAPLAEALRQTHEQAFVVVSGPSAREAPLERLRGRSTYAGNGGAALLLARGVAPSAFVATDRDFFEHRMTMVESALRGSARAFLSFNGVARVCEHDPRLLARAHLVETLGHYYALPQASDEALAAFERPWLLRRPATADSPTDISAGTLRVGFSHDPELGLFSGCTVAYTAAQLALKAGAGRLAFIGLDLGGTGRAYDEAGDARPTTLDKDYAPIIEPSFELLAKAARERGVTLANLSPSSRLPARIVAPASFEAALA